MTFMGSCYDIMSSFILILYLSKCLCCKMTLLSTSKSVLILTEVQKKKKNSSSMCYNRFLLHSLVVPAVELFFFSFPLTYLFFHEHGE